MTTKEHPGRPWTHLVAIVLAAVALTYPFMVRGLVAGHDRPAHIQYQHFFNEQIAHGEFYPRWMPGLNRGRGSPIFFVQYPLPYYVAWALGHLIPNHWGIYTETRTQGLGVVLATILGALFTYAWCSTFVDSLSAMLASLVFLTLPYFFSVDLFLRISVGEFWALTMMPLALYFTERIRAHPRSSLAGLAVAFALVLFSHLFTAVLFAPVLLAYAIWRSEPAKRFSVALQTVCALALGAAVAGIYTLTVFAHSRFLHPESMLTLGGPNYSPLSQLFPYNASMFPVDTRGWRYLAWFARCLAGATIGWIGYACYQMKRERFAFLRIILAIFSIVTLALTIFAGHLPGVGDVSGALPLPSDVVERRSEIFLGSFLTFEAAVLCYWSLRRRTIDGLAEFFVATALFSYLMMTRWSVIVWTVVHPLWSIQFPWRFNVFLALAAAGLAALAFSGLANRPFRERVAGSVFAVILWGLVAGGTARAGYVQDVFWTTQPVAYVSIPDVPLPVYVRVNNLQEALAVIPSQDAGLDAALTSGTGKVTINMVHPRLIQLSAACETACTLQIGQFYYSAWRARLTQDGTEIPLRAASPGGLMEISLPPGQNDVVLDLPRGWSERVGPWLSLVSLLLVCVIALSEKRREQSPARSLAAS